MGVCDLPEAFQIHVLVVPQHLGAGVANEGQLVLIRSLYVLHQRGEGMSAAVRGVFPAIFYDGVFDAAGIQSRVELLAVLLDCHGRAVRVAEDGAGDLPVGESVDGGLDLRRDCDNSVSACFSFGTAGEVLLLPVVVGCVQLQELRGPVTKLKLGHDVVHEGDLSNVLLELFQSIQGKAFFSKSVFTADYQILAHVHRGHVARDCILVQEAADGLHGLLGALARCFVHALLQIVPGVSIKGSFQRGWKCFIADGSSP